MPFIWTVVLLVQKSLSIHFILTDIEHKQLFYDSKTILQEVVQAYYKEELCYCLVGEEGPDHDKHFMVEVWIGEDANRKGRGTHKESGGTGSGLSGIAETEKVTDRKRERICI